MMTAVLVSVISVTTTWVMVDMYTGYILSTFQLQHLQPDFKISDLVGHVTDSEHNIKSDSEAANHKTVTSVEEEDLKEEPDIKEEVLSDEQVSDSIEEFQADSSNEEMQDALPVWNQEADVVFSQEEFDEARNGLSDQEKMRIFSILMARVPQEVLQEVSLWFEDGLTQKELVKIEEMMKEYLQSDEVKEIFAILDKVDVE